MHRYLCSLRSISKMLLAQKQGIKLMLHRGREVKQNRGPSRDTATSAAVGTYRDKGPSQGIQGSLSIHPLLGVAAWT